MTFLSNFESHLPDAERALWRSLDSPFAIQTFLDSMPYVGEARDRSPLNVMLDRQCHCLDGGFLAALALWRIGYRPLLIDIVPDPARMTTMCWRSSRWRGVGGRWPNRTTSTWAFASRFTRICASW